MQEALDQITVSISAYLPMLLKALAVLVVGWLAAALAAAGVREVLRRTKLDNRLAEVLAGEEKGKALPIEDWISRGVYWLVMLFVLVGFFQTMDLTLMSEPVNRLLTELLAFAPRILAAAALLLLAWIVAKFLRLIIVRVLDAVKLDERLGETAEIEEGKRIPFSRTLGDGVYWLVFLLFLPAILEALALQGLLEPIQGMFNKAIGFLPNIFMALVILAVGWLVARIVQRILRNLLVAIGTDQLSERVGIAPALGKRSLSDLIGLVAYVLILIPILIAALNALALDAITGPASNMLNTILTAIPAIFAAVLVVAIAYLVGKVISGLCASLLSAAGFDGFLVRIGLVRKAGEGSRTPSAIAGTLILVTMVFFAVMEGSRLLGFDALGELMAGVAVFAGHVLLALVILALGLFLSNLAAKSILAAGTGQAELLAVAARIAIVTLAGAMALGEIGAAREIIMLAFGLIVGAVAVAAAIAFGIGGREIAARHLESWIGSMRSGKSDS
jgi:hypothetical protein